MQTAGQEGKAADEKEGREPLMIVDPVCELSVLCFYSSTRPGRACGSVEIGSAMPKMGSGVWPRIAESLVRVAPMHSQDNIFYCWFSQRSDTNQATDIVN